MDETMILPMLLLCVGLVIGGLVGSSVGSGTAFKEYQNDVLQSCINDGKKLYVCDAIVKGNKVIE